MPDPISTSLAHQIRDAMRSAPTDDVVVDLAAARRRRGLPLRPVPVPMADPAAPRPQPPVKAAEPRPAGADLTPVLEALDDGCGMAPLIYVAVSLDRVRRVHLHVAGRTFLLDPDQALTLSTSPRADAAWLTDAARLRAAAIQCAALSDLDVALAR
jgi:hypothetical protein